jgi:hypothetical protein
MISSKLFLVAERVIRDSESGSISIINILDDIAAESYPILIHKVVAISYLQKTDTDSGKQTLQFQLFNNSTQIGDHQIKVDFRGKNHTKAIIELGGIPLSEPGKASFVLKFEETELNSYSINLVLREEIRVSTQE